MPAIHILYEASDHLNKATALMNSLLHTATVDPVDAAPRTIAGLTTLIFWGHGSATGLCGKGGPEIVKIIGRWKDKNSNLSMVEIITCNSRHFDDNWLSKKDAKTGQSKKKLIGTGTVRIKPTVHLKSTLTHVGKGKKINNSMAKQVKRGLKYSVYPSIRSIDLKSMPESVNGSFNQYSILYFDTTTTTWCYVTGPSEPEMFEMGNNIKLTKRMPPDPHIKWSKPRTGDFPSKVTAARVDFPTADFSDVQAGTIDQLRGILVDIN